MKVPLLWRYLLGMTARLGESAKLTPYLVSRWRENESLRFEHMTCTWISLEDYALD